MTLESYIHIAEMAPLDRAAYLAELSAPELSSYRMYRRRSSTRHRKAAAVASTRSFQLETLRAEAGSPFLNQHTREHLENAIAKLEGQI